MFRDRKEIIVMKFGGTSVADAEKMRRVADRIIAATSIIENAGLVTADKYLRRSKKVATIW